MRRFGRSEFVDLGNPDFVKYAESFRGERISGGAADELIPILKQAIADNTVVVIDCPGNYSENIKLTQQLSKMVCPV